MKAIFNFALLAALATTAASATEIGNNHHRDKRSPKIKPCIKPPCTPGPLPLLGKLKYKSGGSGASPLPPHIDPNIGMSTDMFQSMPITNSFSGPLSILGGFAILVSFAMAASYFSTVNANQRLGYDYAGPYIQKRSSYDINPEPIMSYINSFR